MKAARIVVFMFLAVLMVMGWSDYLGGISDAEKDYKENLEQARNYFEQKLYVKSVNCYSDALENGGSDEIWLEMTESNRLAYQEKSLSFKDYKNNLKSACEACPQNAALWEELLTQTKENGSSKEAFLFAREAKEIGITDENVLSLAASIIYDFRFTGLSYSEVITSPNGISAVCNDSLWGMLDSSEAELLPTEYNYISPAGNEGTLLVTDMWSHIVDHDGIAQSVILGNISSAKAYGDGYLPVKSASGDWSYIRCSDNNVIGRYSDLSSFDGGFALVKENAGWKMIDVNMSETGVTFDDVKLYANGSYINGGIIIAARGGKYTLYNVDGESVCSKTADGMDVYMGEPVAYKEGNLWGFMDTNGEVVIEPEFEEARSFSNGLAAVKSDGLWGFADVEGRIVIEPQFVDVGYFDSGLGCYVYLGQWQRIVLKNR